MQTILRGLGNIEQVLQEVSGDRYMLVCDSSFDFLPIKDAFHPTVLFNQFTPNPLYEQVCLGVELFHSQKCNAIVAVGGGSTIDMAKCIKLFCRMDTNRNFLQQEFSDSGVPLIAVPTTAGTGSESTRYAVIYFEGKKQSITHESIVPDYAILEPILLKTLPLYQKKCTMLDALCQGIESWWSINSTDESIQLSQRAVGIIIDSWHDYIINNTDSSTADIMDAANIAGQAINITQTTAPHAMSYKLTSLYSLPHGHAVALCLPHVWRYMVDNIDKCKDPRGSDYLGSVFQNIAKQMHCTNATQAIDKFSDMLRLMDMRTPTSDNRRHDIDTLTNEVNPVRLKNNPINLDQDTVKSIYEMIVS